MTDDEKRTFGIMQTEITEIKEDVTDIKRSIDKMTTAIMGSDMTGDGGMVKRIRDLEAQNKEIRTEMQQIKDRNVKMEVYQKIMWAFGGTTLGLLFSYILKIVFK